MSFVYISVSPCALGVRREEHNEALVLSVMKPDTRPAGTDV